MRSLLILLLALAPFAAHAQLPRRILHVSLYPYIPQAAAAALTLKQEFERRHPDVIIDVTFNQNYYSPDPARKGVLYEDADVHEIDGILLSDFIQNNRLAALPASLTKGLDPLEEQARAIATSSGRMYAVPHWMCADFLIYRADANGVPASLADLKKWRRGVLMDLKGSGPLGEIYLDELLTQPNWNTSLPPALTQPPEPAIIARLRDILALEPPGFGRNARYDGIESFYARQFARGIGDGFVGYSELVHDVLEEASNGCSDVDHCVTADQLRVAAFPFADGVVRPAVWVDMFGIDASVHGRRRSDAADFIAFAVSLPAYRALLIPAGGEAPRYLLPATTTAFEDAAITRAAPLYPQFRAIMEQGVAVKLPLLNAHLQALAARLDASLPVTH